MGVIVVLGMLAPTTAQALPITYHYDGGAFTFLGAGVPAGVTGITASFTLDPAPLGSLSGVAVTPSSWHISDGLNAINQSSANYSLAAALWTLADGSLSGFQMIVTWGAALLPNTNVSQSFSWGAPGSTQQTTYWVESPVGGFGNTVARGQNAGTLEVPESSTSLLLLTLGLAALALGRRRSVNIET